MAYNQIASQNVQTVFGSNLYAALFEETDELLVNGSFDGDVYEATGIDEGDGSYQNWAYRSNVTGGDASDVIMGVSNSDGQIYYDLEIPFAPLKRYKTSWYASDYAAETLRGMGGNDVIYGYGADDELYGGTGDDFLNGGSGQDVLDGGEGYDTASFSGGLYGVVSRGNQIINDGFGNSETLVHIEHVIGSDHADNLTTGDNVIALSGGAGMDVLTAAASDEVTTLNGGHGVDFLYGNGNTTAVFDTSFPFFNVVSTGDNDWQVSTLGSTDFLYDVNRFALVDGNVTTSFEVSSSSTNDNYVNGGLTINAVAGTDGIQTVISGNNIGPTDYMIGVRGEVGSYLDFDSAKLASWINEISLPNMDIEHKRLVTNALLSTLGGTEIPATGIISGLASDLANYGYDMAQIEAQQDSAKSLVENDDTTSWGEIIYEVRDTIIITDFQIGVDNIVLPQYGRLRIDHDSLDGYGDGVMIRMVEEVDKNGNDIEDVSNIAFVVNNYNKDHIDDGEFEDLMRDLRHSLVDEKGDAAGTSFTISTFSESTPHNEGYFSTDFGKSFAGDRLVWDTQRANNPGSGYSYLAGYFGDDLLIGDSADNVMYGGTAYDRQSSTDQATIREYMKAYGSNRVIAYSDDGHDLLQGFGGNDALYGESGNDTLDGGEGNDFLNGGEGHDTAVYSGNYADYLFGQSGTNLLVIGADGFDTLAEIERLQFADQTVDVVDVSIVDGPIDASGNVSLSGGAGNDTLDGGVGNDTLNGGAGNDTLNGGVGNDTLDGGSGNDTLNGGDDNDTLIGRGGADTLNGGAGNDTLNGLAGTDTLNGGAGDDELYGGEKNDELYGGTGDDFLNGGAGDDFLVGGAGNDFFDGGTGEDAVNFFEAENGITVDLSLSSNQVINDGFGYADTLRNIEVVQGSQHADNISGSAGADTLVGRAGNDTLVGGAGDDTLFGWEGNDHLNGGAGRDELWGDAGSDTFFFDVGADTFSRDTIRDFESGTDQIMIDMSAYGISDYSDLTYNNGTLSFGNTQVSFGSSSNFTSIEADVTLV